MTTNNTTPIGVESKPLGWEDYFQSIAVTDVPVILEGTGEDKAYLDLSMLYQEFYKESKLDDLLVEIPLDKNGVRHYFGRHNFDKTYKDELTLKVLSIKEAIRVPACGYCVADPSSTELASRVVDKDISRTLECILALREIKPLDHDIDKIVDGVKDLKAHINLCVEFQAYESSVEESITDILNGTVGGDYNEIINLECERVVKDVERLADLTIRSDKLKSRSKSDIVKKYLSRNISEKKVKIVLAPLFATLIDNNEIEDNDLAILANLVYSKKRNSWAAELVELPHWIGELIAKDQGRAALSKLYQEHELDPKILETAQILWKPDRYEPSNLPFDTAIEIAKRV